MLVNLEDETSANLKYGFLIINNPKIDLGEGDVIVVEEVLCNLLRCSVGYNVAQKVSSLTATSKLDQKGVLECSTATTCFILNQDVTFASKIHIKALCSLIKK